MTSKISHSVSKYDDAMSGYSFEHRGGRITAKQIKVLKESFLKRRMKEYERIAHENKFICGRLQKTESSASKNKRKQDKEYQ